MPTGVRMRFHAMPTIWLDEADTVLWKKSAGKISSFFGVMNSES